MCLVRDTLETLHSGRRVLSTVRLQTPDGADHPMWESLTDYQQIMDAEHCDVLLDEVTGVASSRESQSMPVQVQNLLVQLRRRDVVLRWSAPHWARADKIIREVSQAVTYCRGFIPEHGEGGRLWGANRVFYWMTYDAVEFEEFATAQRDKIKPRIRELYVRNLASDQAQNYYDTLHPVTSLGWADQAGLCLVCGGKRSVPRCECVKPAGRSARGVAPLVPQPTEVA